MVFKVRWPKYELNLQRRFILRVLLPPFIALLLLSLVGFWQLDKLLREQAVSELKRSATALGAKLDREFAMRETVLKRTGEELFVIKSEYQSSRKKLDENREACRAHVRQRATFQGSPGGVCEPFSAGSVSLSTIENEYVKKGEELIKTQNQRINERLSAFKQFFPETLALVVVDDKQVVSSAFSGAFKGSDEDFMPDAKAALIQPIRGKTVSAEDFELGIFAYPITGGSVLAAYDLNHENFLRQTWESAPIDRKRALAVILDAEGRAAYPDLQNADTFVSSAARLRSETYTEIKLEKVPNIAVAAPAGESNWLAVVASPKAAVLAPLRDAQLAGVIAISLLLAGFVWVGTFFMQRIVRNIIRLVSGALVFGSGKLDYKISLVHADKEILQLAETMNNMAERIAEAEKEIDVKNKEFISIATHELRAPMTAIIGYLSIFKEKYGKNLDESSEAIIDQVFYSTVRLRDLVNDMLNVARLEAGKNELSLVTTDAKKIAKEVVDTMGVVSQISKVNLDYDDKHVTSVIADEGRLRIVFNNLISNAIKYNRPGGKVKVTHKIKDKQLITSVSDDGLGIPKEQQEHMFEKFFRVKHDDRKNVTGTGLGMYITSRYVREMNGKIWFESEHGKGTTFYFSLPISS